MSLPTKPGYGDVVIHWAESQESAMTTENEASLRRKIVKAEGRRRWQRNTTIGATGASAVWLLGILANWITAMLRGL